MCISDKPSWSRWLRETVQRCLAARDLTMALKSLAQSITSYYPHTKVWFAQRFGKRYSFLAGAGQEFYLPAEKIEFDPDYSLFWQIQDEITPEEREILIAVCKIVIAIYKDALPIA